MPFDPANLTTVAARHQRLMQIRYGHESHGLTTEQKLQKILHYCAVELDVARAGLGLRGKSLVQLFCLRR